MTTSTARTMPGDSILREPRTSISTVEGTLEPLGIRGIGLIQPVQQPAEGHPLASDPAQDPEKQNRPQLSFDISSQGNDCVDWDGPDDPAKPVNWPLRKKAKNIAIICYLSFLTLVPPLSTTPHIPTGVLT
jgi:hypothetical protein